MWVTEPAIGCFKHDKGKKISEYGTEKIFYSYTTDSEKLIIIYSKFNLYIFIFSEDFLNRIE